MTISLVIQDLYRLGAQYVTALVARGLAQRGHQVEVVVSAVHDRIGRERPDLHPFPLPDAIRLVRLPHLRASRNVFALARQMRCSRPQIIMPMSSNYEVVCALAQVLSLHHPRARLVPVEHMGGIGMRAEQSKVGGQGRRGAARVSAWAASRADRVIAVSQGVAEAVVRTGKYPASRVEVVSNPVVDDEFFRKCQLPPTHPWLADKTLPVIAAAGAHVPLKGFDVLLRAFASVRELQACRLIIFGEGALTGSLKQLASDLGVADAVSFPGHTSNLPAELKAADVFVVSSHCESFSVVLVEALACGVPVVATNCPSGPPEILKNGQYGLLVAPNNPEALASGIVRVLSGDGIRPPPESWQPYTLDRVMDRYEALFMEVLSS